MQKNVRMQFKRFTFRNIFKFQWGKREKQRRRMKLVLIFQNQIDSLIRITRFTYQFQKQELEYKYSVHT